MKHIYLWVVMALMLGGTAAAQEPLYAVGGFNGWDARKPVQFTYADGLYTLEIDFSKSNEFKLSTTAGTAGDGWGEFDKGTLYPTGTLEMDRWCHLKQEPRSANIVAPSNTLTKVTVDMATLSILFGESDQPATAWSGTLPVMFINTVDAAPITGKEKYVDATYYIDPMGCEGVEALGSKEAPLVTQIKGRGNYTWSGFEKKPYRLKFKDKASPLGMPSSRHFVLLAHADDNLGFQRNECGLTISRLLGMPWTPESEPLEVVLNGDYIGLYFLTQNVRVSKERVNVTEQQDLATTDVDGGWLVEIDNYDTDPHVTVQGPEGPIWFTYKSPEELSTQQEAYLQSQMDAINDAIYNGERQGDDTPLSRLVDFDVLARYYITQEIVDDTESFHGSCYLNRQRGESEKWKFGPVWDFGNAFQREWREQFIFQNPTWSQVWIGGIYEFPAFQAKVKEIWAWWLGFGPQAVEEHAVAFAQKIQAAAACDLKRWPQYGNADILGKADAVIGMMARKTDWLKSQWGSEASVGSILPDGAYGQPDGAYDPNAPVDVYTPQGTLVLRGATPDQISALPAGLYILPGRALLRTSER